MWTGIEVNCGSGLLCVSSLCTLIGWEMGEREREAIHVISMPQRER